MMIIRSKIKKLINEEAPEANPDIDSMVEKKKNEGFVEDVAIKPADLGSSWKGDSADIWLRCYTDYYAEFYSSASDGKLTWKSDGTNMLSGTSTGAGPRPGSPLGIFLYMTKKFPNTGVRGAFNDYHVSLTAEPDGTILKVGDSLGQINPGSIYKVLKKSSNSIKENFYPLRALIREMLIKEEDVEQQGISAEEFVKEKLGKGYTEVSSLKLPIGDYGIFRLNGREPNPGTPEEEHFGPGPTSRWANEIRICTSPRSAAAIESGLSWNDHIDMLGANLESLCPDAFSFAYVISKEPLPAAASQGIRGPIVALPTHATLSTGVIKVGDVIDVDGRGAGKINIAKIIVNQTALSSLKKFFASYN